MNKYFLPLFICLFMPTVFAQLSYAVPGQGINPPPVIGGDALPSPAVSTGVADGSNGSIFQTRPEQIPLIINLRMATYSHNTHQYMGKRNVLTLRTDTLNAMKIDLITSILQIDLNSASANENISVDISESQLAQIQNVLISHPYVSSQPTWLFHYLPVVRKFCYWAVVLGVVFATVMLSVAAYGMVMSHRGSADKVISTVAGLMVLLMAYTIYSLLIRNAQTSTSQSIQTNPLQ